MTAQEYIDATNLAKVRAALAVLRTIITTAEGVVTDAEYSSTVKHISAWEEKLTEIVKTEGE